MKEHLSRVKNGRMKSWFAVQLGLVLFLRPLFTAY